MKLPSTSVGHTYSEEEPRTHLGFQLSLFAKDSITWAFCFRR